MLVPGKIEKVLCLGNVTDRSTFQYLQSLSPEFLGVKGEYDDPIIYHHKKVPATQALAGQRSRNGLDSGIQPLASGSAASAAVSNSHYGIQTASAQGSISTPSGNGNFIVPHNSDIMSNAPDGVNIHTLASISGGQFMDAHNKPYQQQQPQFNDPHRKSFSNTLPQPELATSVEELSLPLSRVVSLGQLKIGFNSGHTIIPNSDPDALLIAARQLDVDIFIWGGTHRVEAYQLEGKFFVNPGSATGAFYTSWPDTEELEEETDSDSKNNEGEAKNDSGETEDSNESSNSNNGAVAEPKDPIPSFCLLDIQGSICVVYIYRYVDGEVKVDKISYRKEDQ